MKRINFKKLTVYKDLSRKEELTVDSSQSFANIIYQQGSGVAALALALKIYNAAGEEEYSNEECRLIRQYAELCNPFFIEAVNKILGEKDNETDKV